jgi:hypothetical protein
VVGSLHRLGSQPPGPAPETDGEQQEKHPDHFEKNDVSHAPEGLEESAYAAPNRARRNARTARRLRLSRIRDDRWARGRRRPCFRDRGCGQALPGHAPCDAYPDPQHPADGLRFHTRL